VASQAPAGTVALAVGAAVAVWQEPLVVKLLDDDFLDFDEELPLLFEQPHEHEDCDVELVSGVTSREGCSWYWMVMHHSCVVSWQLGDGL
jgi:hypothetical protein